MQIGGWLGGLLSVVMVAFVGSAAGDGFIGDSFQGRQKSIQRKELQSKKSKPS